MQNFQQYYQNAVQTVRNWWEQLKEDRNVFVFMIFLVLSTIFWFMNALQKNYTTTIEYPVRFVNIPQGYILKDKKVKELTLKVNSGGFNILRYHLSSSVIPLDIDVKKMREISDKKKTGFYLLTAKYFKSIDGQLSNGLKLISISPDTLFIRLSPKKTKRVPIAADIKTTFEKQYLQAGSIILDPDSVTITGDMYVVDSIKEVYTKHSEFEKLRDTLVALLPLRKIEGIKYSKNSVKVTVPVEPFTESTIQVPIEAVNVPDTFRLKAFPPEVTVSFRVSLSRFEKIKADNFKATIYFTKDLIDDNNQRIKVKLEKVPDGLYYVNYSPLFVEYLLEKR